MILLRSLGIIFPGATATMSTVPTLAQIIAALNTATMAIAMARPVGEGGASITWSAAGRNASSSFRRSSRCFGKAKMLLRDIMQPCLEPIEGCISAARPNQVIVGAILDQTAPLDGDDAVRHPQG